MTALTPAGVFAAPARAAEAPVTDAVALAVAGAQDPVTLTNVERRARGLGSLAVAADLAAEAQRHAADMAAAGALWHTPDLANRVRGWKRLGENVGRGPNAPAIHAGFMASPSHRANVLQAAYTQIGVGTATTADGRLYVSVLYRLPAGARPPRAAVAKVPATAAAKAAPAVEVQGATVTRPAPQPVAAHATQLAAGGRPIVAVHARPTRSALSLVALFLLALAIGGHAAAAVTLRAVRTR